MTRDELLKRCYELIDQLEDDDLEVTIQNALDQIEYKQLASAYQKRIEAGRVHYYRGEYYTQKDYDEARTLK